MFGGENREKNIGANDEDVLSIALQLYHKMYGDEKYKTLMNHFSEGGSAEVGLSVLDDFVQSNEDYIVQEVAADLADKILEKTWNAGRNN